MADDSEPPKKPPLSCTCCRTRKLKCDKQSPCGNCERSGSECVFPARKRIQRPRKTKNAELLQRLKRLESIVGRVGLADLDESESAHVDGTDAHAQVPEHQLHPTTETDSRAHDENITCGIKGVRPPQDSTASRFLSGEFWSSLCDEVGGLKQALEQSTDSDDDEEDGEGNTPESVGGGGSVISTSPGMLLGSSYTRFSPAIQHPSPNHIRHLASVYFRNVDMYLKILHQPTIMSALHKLADHPETASDLSHELTALFFAIYYAAITSLTSAECVQVVGRPRADLATLFEAGIEQALVRADYLNNTSLETLQALTLYACCLRSHNGSRASWVLLGLPIRLAQALNMHQDGDGTSSSFSPYEAELRRRLWWQLIVLDIRAAEDRGTSTIISRGSYNTRLPHNIDDIEFGPDTTLSLQDRPGPSDTTFCLLTAQSSGIFLWGEYNHQEHYSEEQRLLRAKHLESQFVNGADPTHAGSYLASATARLIIMKMWLITRYPLHPRKGQPGIGKASTSRTGASEAAGPSQSTAAASASTAPSQHAAAPVSRESTLRTAISIIELSEAVAAGPYSDRFRWWAETYVQWHPLAVALAELCTQTQGETVEHAWRVVEAVFPRSSAIIADTKRGSLWRPLRKLYKKAKAARTQALGNAGHASLPQSRSRPQPISEVAASTSAARSHLGGLESTIDYMAIDPALAPEGESSIQPRLITDMIIWESSAHTLTSGSPTPYAALGKADITTPPNTHAQNSRRNMDTSMGSAPSTMDDLINDPGQSIVQALLGWPDLTFDIPPAPSAGEPAIVPLQAPASEMMDTGYIPTASDQGFPDPPGMNWSTWDEFVLDTYAGSAPRSGSLGSEGS
ncbi:fungal-specific transcription factor domain-containing protein [Xylaria bambusicola]|uniref:fungal-specific transcription factor domain-containing protein n=1 Tax=Xylaria bambusicola TaxID=326684 RepID=UPI002008E37E|nr:fungal-specific transcription factor domain-containing protein [Xylaria bambusicola]KAI0505780.1 fungal-specific transcription factor domain-containing protein [Xylaria bambusicola]